VQYRYDGDHRALGLEPKAAQRLDMLDRSHRFLLPALPRSQKR
jgi:hypothetical protein